MALPLHHTQIRGRAARWLLDLTWYRRGVVRFSDRAVSVSSDAGDLEYAEGLGADLSVSTAAEVEDITITIRSDLVDWLAEWRRGASLERIPATLRRWYVGTSFESARVVSDGYLVRCSVGDPRDPSSLRGRLVPRSVAAERTTPDRVLDWTDFHLSAAHGRGAGRYMLSTSPSNGKFRTIVIGRPGAPDGDPAVPALEMTLTGDTIADSQEPTWFLADHAMLTDAGAGHFVYLTDLDTVAVTTVYNDVELEQDEQGRIVTWGQSATAPGWPAPAGSPITANQRCNTGRSFWYGFTDAIGGLANPYRPGVLRGLGDVLRWLYEFRGGRLVDGGSCESFAAELNQYLIDFAWTDPVTVDEWVEAEILRVYPVRIIRGPAGVYFRRRSFRATSADVVVSLSVRGNGIRVDAASALVPLEVSLASAVVVQYAFRAMSEYLRSVRIGITPEIAATGSTFARAREDASGTLLEGGSHFAEVAAANFGATERTIQVPTTWDPSTAGRIALDYLDRESLPRYRRTYTGGRELEALRIGDVVELDDPAIFPDLVASGSSFPRPRLATIEDVVFGGEAAVVTVEIIRDPLIYTVPT